MAGSGISGWEIRFGAADNGKATPGAGSREPEAGVPSLEENWEGLTAEEVLRRTEERFGRRVVFACSFGAEDMVVLDLLSRTGPGTRVLLLDTGLLFPETHRLLREAEERYPSLEFRKIAPPPEEERHALWESDPDLCCRIRKVEPLRRALREAEAWITGIRREQAPARSKARKLEWDHRFGLFKVNPLADWSWEKVWDYLRRWRVPYNPLHDRGYPSIGCVPCTRPVEAGEDLRAGRWAGRPKTECGLHG